MNIQNEEQIYSKKFVLLSIIITILTVVITMTTAKVLMNNYNSRNYTDCQKLLGERAYKKTLNKSGGYKISCYNPDNEEELIIESSENKY